MESCSSKRPKKLIFQEDKPSSSERRPKVDNKMFIKAISTEYGLNPVRINDPYVDDSDVSQSM